MVQVNTSLINIQYIKIHTTERDPMVCAIMKKKVDKPFEIPQQHLYSGENITSDEIGKKYK